MSESHDISVPNILRAFEKSFSRIGWILYPSARYGASLIEDEKLGIHYVLTGSDSVSRPISLKRIQRTASRYSRYKNKDINKIVFLAQNFSESIRRAIQDPHLSQLILIEFNVDAGRVEILSNFNVENNSLIQELKSFILEFIKTRKEAYKRQLAIQHSLFQEVISNLKKGKTGLRFNRPWISASSISQQYFCERKIEMQFLHGKIDTEPKQIGTEAHDLLLAKAEKTSREELFQRIYSGELVIPQEMSLLSRHQNLILAGTPDAIVFHRGIPLFLFEYKFSRSPIPYDSYHVQAKVYGKILEGMDFDMSLLHYVIAVVPHDLRKDENLFEKIFKSVMKNGLKEARLKVGEANVYVYPYRSEDAKTDIDWALDFWRGNRESIPTQNLNKCKNCEYKESCKSS